MALRLIQSNVGRSQGAQDILLQTMMEHKYTFGIIAEPSRIPSDNPCWAADTMGSVALFWRWLPGLPPCVAIKSGSHFVAAQWGQIVVIEIYFPPSGTLSECEIWLDELSTCIRRLKPLPFIIAGNFNAWNTTWGSIKTGPRGRLVETWAVSHDLILLNRGRVSTCIRPQGESIIDLTWAYPVIARKVTKWEVAEDLEHMSDHCFILVHFDPPAKTIRSRLPENRWAVRKLNKAAFKSSIITSLWVKNSEDSTVEKSTQEQLEWIIDTVSTACDASMPRTKYSFRRSTYWWNNHIASLRQNAIRQGRRVTRSRGNLVRRAEAWESYKEAKIALRKAIKESKENS
ncbi:uncharacterized protein [Cardiocondyla obscurior]|uniref:uncharacterized protein n=1 Tax=Cardiocondyla obscurior TaxID=286306 RepID=UPI00396587B1